MNASPCFLQVRQCLHCNQAMLSGRARLLVQLAHPTVQSELDTKGESGRWKQQCKERSGGHRQSDGYGRLIGKRGSRQLHQVEPKPTRHVDAGTGRRNKVKHRKRALQIKIDGFQNRQSLAVPPRGSFQHSFHSVSNSIQVWTSSISIGFPCRNDRYQRAAIAPRFSVFSLMPCLAR